MVDPVLLFLLVPCAVVGLACVAALTSTQSASAGNTNRANPRVLVTLIVVCACATYFVLSRIVKRVNIVLHGVSAVATITSVRRDSSLKVNGRDSTRVDYEFSANGAVYRSFHRAMDFAVTPTANTQMEVLYDQQSPADSVLPELVGVQFVDH